MQLFVKAFFAMALVAGLNLGASAQVAKSTGRPTTQQPGTVIVSSPTTTSQPTQQPQTSVPAQYPSQPQYPTQTQSVPVYTGNDARVQQIDTRLQQIQQERDRLRQEERALRQERAQRLGQTVQSNQQQRHDNGKHKGWYKNGKADGSKKHVHGNAHDSDENENDD